MSVRRDRGLTLVIVAGAVVAIAIATALVRVIGREDPPRASGRTASASTRTTVVPEALRYVPANPEAVTTRFHVLDGLDPAFMPMRVYESPAFDNLADRRLVFGALDDDATRLVGPSMMIELGPRWLLSRGDLVGDIYEFVPLEDGSNVLLIETDSSGYTADVQVAERGVRVHAEGLTRTQVMARLPGIIAWAEQGETGDPSALGAGILLLEDAPEIRGGSSANSSWCLPRSSNDEQWQYLEIGVQVGVDWSPIQRLFFGGIRTQIGSATAVINASYPSISWSPQPGTVITLSSNLRALTDDFVTAARAVRPATDEEVSALTSTPPTYCTN